jgi:hypothetical protein
MERITVKGSAGFSINELPTVAGAIPPSLVAQFQSGPAPILPEFTRLPRPRDRCPITGASRTGLIEWDSRLPAQEKFLFRVRERGKIRGAVFINTKRLLSFMQKAEAACVGDAE